MGIFKKGQIEYDDELNVAHEIVKTVLYVGAIVLLVFLVLKFVGRRSEVLGHSMETTLHDGESIWIDKIGYRFKAPQRYDIVVFPYVDGSSYYVKRIIGLPGETIYIDEDGTIYIGTEDTLYMEDDGTVHNEAAALQETYGIEVIREDTRGIADEPVTIGEDEYFVMGDNRNNSSDSRSEELGPISKDIIEGRAVLRLWPLSKFGTIDKSRE